MIKWRNSVFHNHDTVQKRKLLGGVSFDGGAGGGAGTTASSQTGVQTAQPSFSLGSDLGPGIGTGITGWQTAGNAADEKSGTSGVKDRNETQRDTVSIRAASVLPGHEAVYSDKITMVIDEKTGNNGRFEILKKRIGRLADGIQTFLQGTGARADTGYGRRQKKKEGAGTRQIRKENVLEATAEADYLLDSYNRYGERSTLGKQQAPAKKQGLYETETDQTQMRERADQPR